MLAGIDQQLSGDLGGVQYSSSITVTLGYQRDELKMCPPGFGFLVPRSEGTRMLATTFVHTKFPFRAPDNKALVRCFLGGSKDQGVLKLSDEEITALVRKELKQITGLDGRAVVCEGLPLGPRHGAVHARPPGAHRAHWRHR